MLKIKRKKIYNFKYEIYWKNDSKTFGDITNSQLPPEAIFLNDKLTYFAKGTCTYFNKNEIYKIEIYDLIEKVEE